MIYISFVAEYLLNGLKLLIAWVAHTNVKLKAHYGNIDPIGRAFVTDGMTAVTAMVLSDT